MNYAPTYITAIVSIVIGLQDIVGLDFTNEQWTAFVLVGAGIFTAIRQVVTGRATIAGKRP